MPVATVAVSQRRYLGVSIKWSDKHDPCHMTHCMCCLQVSVNNGYEMHAAISSPDVDRVSGSRGERAAPGAGGWPRGLSGMRPLCTSVDVDMPLLCPAVGGCS